MVALTAAQREHFQTFGFLRLRSYFDSDEMATISGVVEAAWVKEKIEALGEDLFEDDVAKLSEATKAGAAAAGKADLELGW